MSLWWVWAKRGRVQHVREVEEATLYFVDGRETPGARGVWRGNVAYTPALCGVEPRGWMPSTVPATPEGKSGPGPVCYDCRSILDMKKRPMAMGERDR